MLHPQSKKAGLRTRFLFSILALNAWRQAAYHHPVSGERTKVTMGRGDYVLSLRAKRAERQSQAFPATTLRCFIAKAPKQLSLHYHLEEPEPTKNLGAKQTRRSFAPLRMTTMKAPLPHLHPLPKEREEKKRKHTIISPFSPAG